MSNCVTDQAWLDGRDHRDRYPGCKESWSVRGGQGSDIALAGRDRHGNQVPVAGVEQGPAGPDGAAGVRVSEPDPDELASWRGLGGGEAAAPGPPGVGQPAAEPAGQSVRIAGQDQGQGPTGPPGDDLAEFPADRK